MPALKKTSLPAGYSALHEEAKALGEDMDCTVKSVALTTGLPYAVCRAKLAELGRRPGRRCADRIWRTAIEELGFTVRRWTSREVIDLIHSYPKRGIAGLTTHQPRRFPKQWAQFADRKLVLRSHGHVSAYVDGVVQDWAINRSKQVFEVWEVTKA